MPTPSATLVNLTATGDAVTGPGMPTNLVNGLPQACMGDLVAGPVCTGAITATTAVNVLVSWPPGMWDLSSLTKGGTHTPCIGRRGLSPWTSGRPPEACLGAPAGSMRSFRGPVWSSTPTPSSQSPP